MKSILTFLFLGSMQIGFAQLYAPGSVLGTLNPSNNNVGVGTNDPQFNLHISKADASTSILVENTQSTSLAYPGINITNYAGSTTGHPYFNFNNAQGTKNNPASLNSLLGALIFSGHNGVSFVQSARIEVSPEALFTSTNTPTKMIFSTTNPNSAAYSEKMRITSNGNVGIGTPTPQKKLDILTNGNGGLRVMGNTSAYLGSDISIERAGTSSEVGKGSTLQFDDTQFNTHAVIQNSSAGLQFFNYNDYSNGWSERMRVTLDGRIGIGTTTPGSFKLAVEGKIGAREVNVLASGWPDYVFENNYKLPSLDELSTYIKVNKHLPEVPSACTIEENGVNLGEMNKIMLKKIEELTLYVIELKKENEEIKKQLKNSK